MTSNRQEYVLHYWGGIPGRGEYIRLAFESVGHPFNEKNSPPSITMNKTIGHPPHFAPPVLEIQEKGSKGSQSSFISQTPAILAYLAPILHLDGSSASVDDSTSAAFSIRRAQINQVTMTILDLSNECHDSHHPIASAAYYEEQKQEAMKRSKDLRSVRIPKFFSLFQMTLESNSESDEWLIGSNFTIADLTLFQVLEGLHFAFPRLMSGLEKQGKYDRVFALQQRVAAIDSIKSYIASDRRLAFSNGIFRQYHELDDEE